jgi:hypothetical protein
MTRGLELRPRRRVRASLLRGVGEGSRPGDVVAVAHHPVAYVRGATWVVAGLALWVGLFSVDAPRITFGLVLLLALRGAWLMLRTYQDRFVVTDKRIFRIQGVFNQHLAAMPLSRIVDVTLEEPFWGRFSGWRTPYGHLTFENAGQEQGLREIRYIPEAKELNELIQGRAFRPSPPPRGGGGPATPSDLDRTGEIPRVT